MLWCIGLWPQAVLPNVLGMLAAFVLSLTAGRLLYHWVEKPAPTWHQGLRWQAGLVGTGLLVVRADAWM